MANIQTIALYLLLNFLSFKPGTLLQCYNCSERSSFGNSSCFREIGQVGLTECSDANSVCYTEYKYNNDSQLSATHRGRYLDDCNVTERQEHQCFNGGFCLVIHFVGSQKTLLCACLSGWEGHHCEIQEIEIPFDSSRSRRAPKVPRSINEHTVRMLSNACRTREVQTTRCSNGHCFAMYLTDGTRRPFCNCRFGWTGERCNVRVNRTNLKTVTRGCRPSDALRTGCQPIQPLPGRNSTGDEELDTVCFDVCNTNSCNSAPV